MVGVRQAMAADQNFRTIDLRPLDGGDHGVELPLVDHRPKVILVRGPDLQPAGGLDQHVAEPFVNGVEDDDPAARSTALTVHLPVDKSIQDRQGKSS